MARFAGVVFRAADRRQTVRFYEALGLSTREHAHGGPTHHEVGPTSPAFVLEIYLRSAAFPGDAVMVEVDSIAAALDAVRDFNPRPRGELKVAGASRFQYINDPDGRDVMLIEPFDVPRP